MAEETQAEKKIDIFKWAITILITLVLGLTSMNAVILTQVRATQTKQAEDISRINAIQVINTQAIANLNQRVTSIESDKISEVKQWTMDNFVQKSQFKQ